MLILLIALILFLFILILLFKTNKKAITKKKDEEYFTLKNLSRMDWLMFEKLVLLLYQENNYSGRRANRRITGGDGGFDLILIPPTSSQEYIVQCKAWTHLVGIDKIREFIGVIMTEKKPGIFITSSDFTMQARDLAKKFNIESINGNDLIEMYKKLSPQSKNRIYQEIFAQDYITPSCPACETKMVLRESKGKSFWGCVNYPKCKKTLSVKNGTIK